MTEWRRIDAETPQAEIEDLIELCCDEVIEQFRLFVADNNPAFFTGVDLSACEQRIRVEVWRCSWRSIQRGLKRCVH